jgi:hypothetical protein
MPLSTPWIIVIIVVVFAIVLSNIMLLKRSNKGFTFPENFEKKVDDKKDDDEPSSLI